MSILTPSDPLINERQMARYGITSVPVEYFHYKEFRYTNFADALAQAQLEVEQEEGVTAQP